MRLSKCELSYKVQIEVDLWTWKKWKWNKLHSEAEVMSGLSHRSAWLWMPCRF